MNYKIKCLFPNGRHLIKREHDTLIDIDNDGEEMLREDMITLTRESERSSVTLLLLGDILGFSYTRRLLCFHESDLRNIEIFDSSVFESAASLGWLDFLERGAVFNQLSVNYISPSVGFGLFSNENILKGTFIGEYTGLLHSCKRYDSDTIAVKSRYSVSYPSCDGGFEIDASEYGNIIRFVNHSNLPNAEFKSVLLGGLVHIVCVSY